MPDYIQIMPSMHYNIGMNAKADGINYVPETKAKYFRAAGKGEFPFSVIGLDHGHIYGMAKALIGSGAEIRKVYDKDPVKVERFLEKYPDAVKAESMDEVLEDKSVKLIASAIIPSQRAELGIMAMEKGFDFLSDKPGMVSEEQIERVREACRRTGRKYFIYFSERLHVESAMYAQKLIDEGVLGKVVSVEMLAPHRLNKERREPWFFNPDENGSILCDIGSHQFEQLLSYTGSEKGMVVYSDEINYANPDHPRFSDFGEAVVQLDSGAKGYIRVDWFTPDGLSTWGDGRVFIVGTKATLEIRKYLNAGVSEKGDNVILVDSEGEHFIDAEGTVGFPFFRDMILDCINRTENAMKQEHIFESMRLAVSAHTKADKGSRSGL